MNRWIELFLKATIITLVVFFWAALSALILFSADAWKSVAALALLLSVFSSIASLALWVFFLAKQYSTHAVQFVDIKDAIKGKKDTLSKTNEATYGKSSDLEEMGGYEGEEELDAYASSIAAQLLRSNSAKPVKEKLTDNLT